MRGRRLRAGAMRRLMIDLMWLSAAFPLACIRRRMHLGVLADARRQSRHRPPWVALFAKAYDLVASEIPELRHAYVKLPWPHICEYPCSMAVIAVERMQAGRPTVFFARIKQPSQLSLERLSIVVRHRMQDPIEQVQDFRGCCTIARLPPPLRRTLLWLAANLSRFRGNRFGTFGITTVGALGAEIAYSRAPITTFVTIGPVSDDGSVDVGIAFDHRVLDGVTVARVLQRLEETLNARILAELNRDDPTVHTAAWAAE
jgi:hypothetical protein